MDQGGLHQVVSLEAAGRASVRPFVGRVQELADLASALEEAVSGRGSLVLLTGEPGIGKTRLLSELSRVAAQHKVRVVAGRCWEEGGAPPYWPWTQIVRSVGGDLERLVAPTGMQPGQLGPASGVVPEGERLRLFDAVGRFLAAASSEEPLLVTLDDVHAADEPSLLLLRFLGQALAESGVLLVASYREAENRVRERGDVFAELARVGRRIPLRGLTSGDVESYVETVTGSRPTEQVTERLYEITAGNPFFVEEIVRLLVADGSLDGLEESAKDPFLRIPEEVRILIRRRVAGLASEAVAVLRVAAVIGREFDLHLLQHTSRLSPARLLDVLREAATVGVVAELPATPRRYSFAHELVRETLYDDLPNARRLELHRQVGELLETVYGDDLDPHLSEIARHLYLAAPLGDPGHALEYLVRAGDRASTLFAYEEAAAHYRQALELLVPVGEAPGERRCELLLRLGDAQWRSGDGTEARGTFEQAIEGSRRLGKGELLAQAALGYVTALGGFLLYARFEVGGTGVGLLEEALAGLPPGDSSLRAHLLAHLALEMWSGNEPVEQRVAVSQEAIEMARRLGDSEALVTALHSRHWVLTTPGMAMERLAHTEEMLRIAKETGNPEIDFLAHNARFHCFLELCDRRGMDAETQAMTEIAERLRQPFYRWHTVCLRTLRATLDGRFSEAERLAEEALELGRLRQSEYTTYVFRYAQLLAIRWAQGRLPDLWPEIRDHEERFPWIPRWRDPFAAAELGDEQMARRELERHAGRGFGDLPRDGLWILHLCTLAEAAVLVGDAERGLQLYELLLPHDDDNAVSYTQQPFGPVALRLGKLAALLGRWQEADRHFATALARCELLGAPAIRGRVLFEHASALATRGEPADRGRLEAMLEEAAQLCGELSMTGLLERVDALRERLSGEPAGADAVFRQEGEYWTVAYEGRTFRLRDVKGLRYIATLLASPGREIHVLELVSAATGASPEPRARLADRELVASRPSDSGPLLDEQAKDAYRLRLEQLAEELQEARDWGDPERVARLEEEIDALTQELAQAVGLGGRDRTFSSPAERARISVTKAIRTAIKLIDNQSPELAAHLDASIQTGRFCSYATPGAAPPGWSL
jgi:tetratricopeptide (TPR) repeat protein